MLDFARLPKGERDDAVTVVALGMDTHPAIVEKDFWVCWMLRYLFDESCFRGHFAFKGGTSLSKGFGLIERFSEDIDLIFDWRMLGYGLDEPWEKRSNTKQDAFVERINADGARFLAEELRPEMEAYLEKQGIEGWSMGIDEADPQTLRFFYPQSFSDDSILQEIRLETGALAAWTPTRAVPISPYVAERYPGSFDVGHANVRTVAAERTFWEKATILHKEAFRTNDNFPARYSRHYYDLFRLSQSGIADSAMADTALLHDVVNFKMTFWRSNVARYDLCVPGTMRLVPPSGSLGKIREDYESMRRMIYGGVPSFEEVMDGIAALEERINSLAEG